MNLRKCSTVFKFTCQLQEHDNAHMPEYIASLVDLDIQKFGKCYAVDTKHMCKKIKATSLIPPKRILA